MSQNTEIMLQQTSALAKQFNIGGDPAELLNTLKNTVFKAKDTVISNEQFSALLIVANQYKLNPFTKEIYAFPDKQNGIVPVVGVDGWARIINNHPQFNGMEYRYSEETTTPNGAKTNAHEWVECIIYRKDRDHPVVVREYLDEVYRMPFVTKSGYSVDGAWQTHPKRMHRHKATIQAARLAFGFAGIYDQDEAERINESQAAQNAATIDPASGKPDHPEYDTLIQAAEKSANLGLEAYKNFWANRLTAEQRKIIGTENHTKFKAIAENTIEAQIIQNDTPQESEPEHDAAAH